MWGDGIIFEISLSCYLIDPYCVRCRKVTSNSNLIINTERLKLSVPAIGISNRRWERLEIILTLLFDCCSCRQHKIRIWLNCELSSTMQSIRLRCLCLLIRLDDNSHYSFGLMKCFPSAKQCKSFSMVPLLR